MSEQAHAAEEFAEEQEFEIQRCGGDVVVAFTQELELVERPKGGKGKPVLTGKKGHVFDEFELAQRIELLRQMGQENSKERWALGELRRCAIGFGIPPKGYPETLVRNVSGISAESSSKSKAEPRQNWATELIKNMASRGRS